MVTNSPKHGVTVEGRTLAADAETITTVDLDIDGSDFVQSGSVIAQYSNTEEGVDSTTNNSWTAAAALNENRIQIGELIPDGADIVANLTLAVDPGGDQVNARIQNVTDDEPICSLTETGSGFQNTTSGWQSYNPSTTSSPIRANLEFQNNDDTTSVSVAHPAFLLGVQL